MICGKNNEQIMVHTGAHCIALVVNYHVFDVCAHHSTT